MLLKWKNLNYPKPGRSAKHNEKGLLKSEVRLKLAEVQTHLLHHTGARVCLFVFGKVSAG